MNYDEEGGVEEQGLRASEEGADEFLEPPLEIPEGMEDEIEDPDDRYH
ncbi:MAG: hypothetical protein Q8O46_05035 [bacterium]|nr:hypothetical protein [bacterium]